MPVLKIVGVAKASVGTGALALYGSCTSGAGSSVLVRGECLQKSEVYRALLI